MFYVCNKYYSQKDYKKKIKKNLIFSQIFQQINCPRDEAITRRKFVNSEKKNNRERLNIPILANLNFYVLCNHIYT